MTTEHLAGLRWLAEQEDNCPELPPAGGTMRHWSKCSGGCGGTGKVARFPWLRKQHIRSYHDSSTSCATVGCPGWEPILPGNPAYEGAMWKLLVWSLWEAPGDLMIWQNFKRYVDIPLVPDEALVAAVCEALKAEVPDA